MLCLGKASVTLQVLLCCGQINKMSRVCFVQQHFGLPFFSSGWNTRALDVPLSTLLLGRHGPSSPSTYTGDTQDSRQKGFFKN